MWLLWKKNEQKKKIPYITASESGRCYGPLDENGDPFVFNTFVRKVPQSLAPVLQEKKTYKNRKIIFKEGDKL